MRSLRSHRRSGDGVVTCTKTNQLQSRPGRCWASFAKTSIARPKFLAPNDIRRLKVSGATLPWTSFRRWPSASGLRPRVAFDGVYDSIQGIVAASDVDKQGFYGYI